MTDKVVTANQSGLFSSNKIFEYTSKSGQFDMSNSKELTSERGMTIQEISDKLCEMGIIITNRMIGKIFLNFCDKIELKIDGQHVRLYKLKDGIEVPSLDTLEKEYLIKESDNELLRKSIHFESKISTESKPFDVYIAITLSFIKTNQFQVYANKSISMRNWINDMFEMMTTQDYETSKKAILPSFSEKWLMKNKLARLCPNSIPPKITYKINPEIFKAGISLVIFNLDEKYGWSIDTKNRLDEYNERQKKLYEEKKRQQELKEEQERERKIQEQIKYNKEHRLTHEEYMRQEHQKNANILGISIDDYVSFYNDFSKRFEKHSFGQYNPVSYYKRLHQFDGKDLTKLYTPKKNNDEYYFLKDDYTNEYYWILGELIECKPDSIERKRFESEIKRREIEVRERIKEVQGRHDEIERKNEIKLEEARQQYISFCKYKAETTPYFSLYGKERFRKLHWDDEREMLWYSKNQNDEDDDSHPIPVCLPSKYGETEERIQSYHLIQNENHVWKKTLNSVIKKNKTQNEIEQLTNNDPMLGMALTLVKMMNQISQQNIKLNNKRLKSRMKEEQTDEDE